MNMPSLGTELIAEDLGMDAQESRSYVYIQDTLGITSAWLCCTSSYRLHRPSPRWLLHMGVAALRLTMGTKGF
jgi:hypothetical protein